MQVGESRSGAAAVAGGLLAVLGVVALWIAWELAADLRRSHAAYWQWPRVPAQVTSLASATDIEFELPEAALALLGPVRQPEVLHTHAPGHTRILLPAPQPHGLDIGDPVDLALPPGPAEPIAILEPVARFAPPAGALLWLLLLGWSARSLQRSRWGADLLWADGHWIASPADAVLPGALAAAPDLTETPAARQRARRWSAAFGTVFAAVAASALWWRGEGVIVAGVVAIVCLFLLVAVVAAATETGTRRLRHDHGGIVETTWLQTRRIPWAAVASIERVNLNQALLDDHARRRHHRLAAPRSVYGWRITDTAGRAVMELPDELAPAAAFDDLIAKAAVLARARAADAVPGAPPLGAAP